MGQNRRPDALVAVSGPSLTDGARGTNLGQTRAEETKMEGNWYLIRESSGERGSTWQFRESSVY